jgi:hypothetical protein
MAMIGGGAMVDFFYLNADHTKIVTAAGGDTQITSVADRALRIGKDYAKNNIVIQTDFTINEDDGILNASWQHTKFDAAWNTFHKSVVSRTVGGPSSDLEELKDELGVKIGGSAGGSTQDVLMISYGNKDSDGKIPVIVACGTISKSSGGLSFQADTFGKPSLAFVSKGCLKAGGLSVVPALDVWHTSTNAGGVIADTPTPVATLPAGSTYEWFFLTPKVA